MNGKRIFIAIDISDAARDLCSSHIDSLRKEFPQVRVSWERREKLHVTLKFLGPTSQETIADLSDRITSTAAKHRPFELTLGASGSFPEKGKPRVLWIGINGGTDNLIRLQHDIEEISALLGYEREHKVFHPHITIGRIRDHRDAFALAEVHRAARTEPVEFEVSNIVIYESELRPTGSVYSKVSSHMLEAA